jgi:hypothetical protein
LKGLLASVFLLTLLGSGCARRDTSSAPSPSTDPKLSLSSFIEEGNLVGLVAGAKLTRIRAGREVIPVEVAVANIGLPGLTLSPESFTLRDAHGGRYALVSRQELEGYGSTDLDRAQQELPPLVRGKWNGFRPVFMNFTRSFDEPTVTQPLAMPRFSYGVDILYFPRPEGGVRGKVFELELAAPELPDPVFVRFAVAP